MNSFEMIPAICEWTSLLLCIFIALRGSYLFNYYQKLGTLSIYYLYTALFGVTMAAMQSLFIFTEIVTLPPELMLLRLSIVLLSGMSFVGFMYLLWKRPQTIGFVRIAAFIFFFAFIMTILPMIHEQKAGAITSPYLFNIWHYPIGFAALILLVSVIYYYCKIMHFKNGLSVVVIFSLIPFIISSVLIASNPTGNYSVLNYIFYAISFIPMSIKLTIEGLSNGNIGTNNNSSVGKLGANSDNPSCNK